MSEKQGDDKKKIKVYKATDVSESEKENSEVNELIERLIK